MRQGDQTSFYFLKKLYLKEMQVVRILVSIIFGSPGVLHTMKTNCMKLQSVNPEIFLKVSGANLSPTFCAWFFKKNVSHVIFF